MENTFITIAKFQYTSEAQIIKGRLEADGIEVFLRDNFTIDTDPLVSQAIGGVKLKVLAKDKDTAMEVLQSIKAYSLDNEGNPIICPNCGQNRVELFSTINDFKSFFSFIVGFLFCTLPFNTRYQYRCENCNSTFPVK